MFLRRDWLVSVLLVAREAFGAPPAAAETSPWALEKAYRETTPTRERMSINGLWRWQPAERDAASVSGAA